MFNKDGRQKHDYRAFAFLKMPGSTGKVRRGNEFLYIIELFSLKLFH